MSLEQLSELNEEVWGNRRVKEIQRWKVSFWVL